MSAGQLGRAKQFNVIDLGIALRVHGLTNGPGKLGELFNVVEDHRLPVLLDEEEPVAAPRHVAGDLADAGHIHLHALGLAIARHVLDGDGAIRVQGRRHHAHASLDTMRAGLDAPEMCQRDHKANRPVPAHLQHPDVVEEDDAHDARLVRRLHQQGANDHIRAARFIHHRGAEAVVLLAEDFQLLGDTAAAEVWPAADDDARRFTAGV